MCVYVYGYDYLIVKIMLRNVKKKYTVLYTSIDVDS